MKSEAVLLVTIIAPDFQFCQVVGQKIATEFDLYKNKALSTLAFSIQRSNGARIAER
jgi:hypothetical protein